MGISKLHREVIDHKMDLEIVERAKVSTDLETNPWKRLGTRARLRRGGKELEHHAGLKQPLPREAQLIQTS